MRTTVYALILSALASTVSLSAAADESDYTLTLKDHRFTPTDMVLPKGTRVKLTVKNLDDSPAEFESHDLDVEKIIPGGSTISVFVGPLQPGRYSFVDEYHEDESKAFLSVE